MAELRRFATNNLSRGGFSVVRDRWIEVLYILGMVVMTAGIVNAAIQPVNYRYIIFPGQGAQSISETVINALALLIGSGGIYMSYMSGRQTTRPRMVSFYLAIGLLMIAIGIYVGIYVYISK
jgi:hypothetical protein